MRRHRGFLGGKYTYNWFKLFLHRIWDTLFPGLFLTFGLFSSLLKWYEFISCYIYSLSVTSSTNKLKLANVTFSRHVFFIPFVNTKGSYAQTKFFSQPVHKISMLWSIQTFSLDINATPILQCSLWLLWQIWQKLNKSCEMQSLNHGGLTGSSQTSSVIEIEMLDAELQEHICFCVFDRVVTCIGLSCYIENSCTRLAKGHLWAARHLGSPGLKWKGEMEPLSRTGLKYSDGKLRYCVLRKGPKLCIEILYLQIFNQALLQRSEDINCKINTDSSIIIE